MLGGGALWLLYAILIEPMLLRRQTVEWRFKGVRLQQKPLQICFVSDMHTSRYGLQERNLQRLLPAGTDLLILGGDIASNERNAEAAAQVFRNISAPLGRFAVLGNMEHKPGADLHGMQKVLCREGFYFLIDEWVRIPLKGVDLILAGVEDVYSQMSNLQSLIDSLPERTGTLRILLSHSPQIVLNPLAAHFDLVLSGHTHGGQVRVPFWGALYAHNPLGARFARGFFTPESLRAVVDYEKPPHLYVSAGVGTGYLRVRFACLPEVTLFKILLDTGDIE